MNFYYKILFILKKIYLKFAKKNLPTTNYKEQEASDYIKEKLLTNEALMICRFGSVELDCVLNYLSIKDNKSFFKKSYEFIIDKRNPFWWDKRTKYSMRNNAGFFPVEEKNLEEYSKHVLENIKNIDILGSWLEGEKNITKFYNTDLKTVKLRDLEPYYHEFPWSEVLENKKVLVIHPFSETIENQYKKRKLIFENKMVLPKFELITYKPVQSIAFEKTNFNNWFEALDLMCDEIDLIDYDIAIIGAGAYGFSLANHIKSKGKQAIHLGGATQILFGIKGKRWEEREFFKKLFNDNWTKPSENEKPKNAKNVENSCYW
jgi:hypothetical protein